MNRPPIKKTCPKCGGLMYIQPPHAKVCGCANGNGEVYNYLTPAQWEAETGEKMLGSDPVWGLLDGFWYLGEYGAFKEDFSESISIYIVARPGQPRPLEDYKP